MDQNSRFEREHKATNALIRDIENIISDRSLSEEGMRKQVRRAIHRNELLRAIRGVEKIVS